jgi:peptidoglycan/LPS O-acetylase OafA/YrhL
MSIAAGPAAPAPAPAPPLPLAEQVARDARTRAVAAAAVVLVHAAWPPGHAALAGLSPPARQAAEVGFSLLVTFPVNAFVLLAFLSLAPRLRAGVPARTLLGTLARRLGPPHLFWTAAYLGAHALHARAWPSPGAVVEGALLGTAAAHLYFTPLLLALAALAPALERLSRTPVRAVAGAAALALAGIGLHLSWRPEAAPARAVVGLFGFAPFAVAGLALGRAWRGLAPPARRAAGVLAAAAAATVSCAAALAAVRALRGPGFDPLAWLAGNGLALGVPLVLLSAPGRVPPWMLRVARHGLGVYLVHPFFVQALRLAEARVPALAGREALLVLPNAAAALALSLGFVALLARTPLRRVAGA